MKRIVIIGATSGIGLEVATLCIREGWRVGAAGRREEALEALRATAPEQVETEPLDITHDDAPGQLARLIDKLGGMDIYLHCSGIGKRNTGLLPEIELDTLRTNGEGFVRMVTAAFGYFRANGGGHLAVISSIAGTKGLGSAPARVIPAGRTLRLTDEYIKLSRAPFSGARLLRCEQGYPFVLTAMRSHNHSGISFQKNTRTA